MLSALRPPIVDNRPKPKNPFEGYDFMEGFQDSEFYKKANRMQQDAVNFKFDGKDMMMNSSMAGALRQYLDSIGKGDLIQSNLVNSRPLQPLPEGVQIGSGPVRGGFFNNDGTAFTGPNPLLNSNYDPTTLYEGGRRPPSFFDPSNQGIPSARDPGKPGGVQLPNGTGTQMPLGGFPIQIPEGGAPKIGGPAIMGLGPNNIANQPLNPTPPNNTGIGSLTENPINTTPESNIMGSMTSSPYLNNNQDLDQYLNSYVENLINRRMRDIFGGIMSIFQ